MTEATDHRIELAVATDVFERLVDAVLAVANEAHAIAHDLHRIADALEYQSDDQPGPGNVEADFTEDGRIILPRRA